MKTPEEMLNVRNWLEEAIKAKGAEVWGAGTSLVEPVADISLTFEGYDYNVSIRFTGAHSKVPAEAAA